MSTPSYKHATISDWIASEAIPFPLDSPEALNSVIDRALSTLGPDISVLGYGEALHGGEEILLLRNQIFQRLVESHGYTAIAIESSFPRGPLVNDLIAGRGAATYDEVRDAGFGHAFGRVELNRELIEWMRQYNSTAPESCKLSFYGFDMPAATGGPATPRELLYPILDYLQLIEANIAARRDRIEPLLGEDSRWESPMPWRDPDQQPELLASARALRSETENILSELTSHAPQTTNTASHQQALHYANITLQYFDFFDVLARSSNYGDSLAVRDALMADNLHYILAREQGRGKVFVHAHNMHLQRGLARWRMGPMLNEWKPAGMHIAETLGARYAVIGTAVAQSDDNGIETPQPGTLESQLGAIIAAACFIPTHRGAHLPPAEIAALPTRTSSTKNPTYFPLGPESFTNFDAIILFDSVTYYRGGRPLP